MFRIVRSYVDGLPYATKHVDKGCLKYHTYIDFKLHRRAIFQFNIGLSLHGKKIKFKLPKGARYWSKVEVEKKNLKRNILDNYLPNPKRKTHTHIYTTMK